MLLTFFSPLPYLLFLFKPFFSIATTSSALLLTLPCFDPMNDKGGGNNDGKWASVPVFGEWDAAQAIPDYSMDFSKIREMKMKNKHDLSGLSIGNESELLVPNSNPRPKNPSPPPRPNPPPPGPLVVLPDVDGDSTIVKKRIWDYLPRCLKA